MVVACVTLISVLGSALDRLGDEKGPRSSASLPAFVTTRVPGADGPPPAVGHPGHPGNPGNPGNPGRRRGGADGSLPDGVTVFDADVPGVAKLDRALLGALRDAATDAADDGIEFVVNSGWRTRGKQEQLLRDAVATYGSAKEAARWVATPETSAHVSGDAVDLGPIDAVPWMSRHGATYGLCQIYRNEPWHYELRPAAVDDGCPDMYADPTEDPRVQP